MQIPHRTLIATFYAFKGGTGRTLALANVARFLAEEMGYRVGLIDLDVDSPGLVHEPLCASLDPTDADNANRTELQNIIDQKKGFVDCFLDWCSDPEKVGKQIGDYVIPLNSGKNGGILLMPPARSSVHPGEYYSASVRTFMQEVSTNLGTNKSSEITWTILETFSTTYQLDFLFLDGRTGTGPFYPVYVHSVPHLLVLFLGLNDQNITGSLSVLNAKAEGVVRLGPVILVASPVPTVGPRDLEQRLGAIQAHLAEEEQDRRDSQHDPNHSYIYQLPRKVDHTLWYSDAAVFREVYFPGRYPHSLLARAYRQLALAIEELVLKESLPDARQVGRMTLKSDGGPPIKIAVENVHKDLLDEFCPSSEFQIQGFAAEDLKAPWEQWASSDWNSIAPDVLLIPQIHLQKLSDAKALHSVADIRSALRDKDIRAFDFEFMDTFYPHWRRWCSVEQGIMALPFSVNATLVCADEQKLKDVCSAYWKSRGQTLQGALSTFFIPSNWPTLIEMLTAWKTDGHNVDNVFRIVGKGRGLYYEWLNLVASLGGFDLYESEGRLLQGVALAEASTVEGTKLFLHLAHLSGKEKQSERMEDQIKSFAARELALYVAWTDSFRFNWKDGTPDRISIVSLDPVQTGSPRQTNQIRLGRCPRDMRYRRTSLVDGWLTVFPKKAKEVSRSALRFVEWFLDPELQTQLLQRGFPSPSGTVVQAQLEALAAQRLASSVQQNGFHGDRHPAETSYEVFLETMKAAINKGRWVASTKPSVHEDITAKLEELLGDDDVSNVEKTLLELAHSVSAKLDVPLTGDR
jgi:ABC-type glycerol-3-phosphate transport system substrate-binding protein